RMGDGLDAGQPAGAVEGLEDHRPGVAGPGGEDQSAVDDRPVDALGDGVDGVAVALLDRPQVLPDRLTRLRHLLSPPARAWSLPWRRWRPAAGRRALRRRPRPWPPAGRRVARSPATRRRSPRRRGRS